MFKFSPTMRNLLSSPAATTHHHQKKSPPCSSAASSCSVAHTAPFASTSPSISLPALALRSDVVVLLATVFAFAYSLHLTPANPRLHRRRFNDCGCLCFVSKPQRGPPFTLYCNIPHPLTDPGRKWAPPSHSFCGEGVKSDIVETLSNFNLAAG